MNKKRKIILAMIMALLAYIGSYMILSVQGQYVPKAWGLYWVKFYWWAPRGFVSGPAGIEARPAFYYFFFPLWVFDIRLVHTYDKVNDGIHPINTTLNDALQKQTKQWKQTHASEPARTDNKDHDTAAPASNPGNLERSNPQP